MLLVIDVGNTNTVFAVFEGEKLQSTHRMETKPYRAKEYQDILDDVFPLGKIKGAVISSVVPDVTPGVSGFCRDVLSCSPLIVTRDVVDIKFDMEKPEEVGADRIVNAIAVLEYYSAPAVVVDFGTATTFDVVDAQGRYAGGVIAPGINLSLAALEQAAAKLPDIEIEKPGRVIGKNTIEAMQSGIYWGYASLIEGVLDKIFDEMGAPKPLVLATGGLAPLFSKAIPSIKQVDQDLTLKGLLAVYRAHKK